MTEMSNTNTKVLLARLIEYRKSLENHLNQLGSEYMQLENFWRIFNACSEGNYAEQFRAGWLRTETNFNAYLVQGEKIKSFLNERIKYLALLNRESLDVYLRSSLSPVTPSRPSSSQAKIEANSGDLRNNMGKVTDNKIPHTNQYYPEGKYQAHHVIPGESANNSPLVRAAIDLGFDLDSAINGIYLPATDEQQQVLKMMTDVELPKHSGYHSTYSRMIDDILEIHWQDLGDGDRLSAYFLSKNDTELEPKIRKQDKF
ncbi:MAG: AHH domain-containing protein [Roseofilum sp. SBFL]|nr:MULTISPECIES: AHH domain-containing protein [unclassified Roseofilum]MBP0011512.1 AHH domain-containing protein [Roseofilum sp. SID3]MBP0022415.1 AHH domain-containing protein [Roseofilum sp. SID2]MBP0036931.1 AHH domain-containing protein [Roseofilum sp. SID1]MBP0044423.1 AHH domain-containing protein [Roseofilum sp. SBFL]